jgi:hypothetical protein
MLDELVTKPLRETQAGEQTPLLKEIRARLNGILKEIADFAA